MKLNFGKKDIAWSIICTIMVSGAVIGSKIYNDTMNRKVYVAMANYMNQAEDTINKLYMLAKEYEAIIKRCKCAHIK